MLIDNIHPDYRMYALQGNTLVWIWNASFDRVLIFNGKWL